MMNTCAHSATLNELPALLSALYTHTSRPHKRDVLRVYKDICTFEITFTYEIRRDSMVFFFAEASLAPRCIPTCIYTQQAKR